jgi:hypothetical protein
MKIFCYSLIILSCGAFLSCGDTDNAAGPVTRKNPVVTVADGATYTFENTSEQDNTIYRDTSRTRLLSKIATVGGRTGLIAFQSGIDPVSFWDVDTDGEMWQYWTYDGSAESLNHGVWARMPTSGKGEYRTVLMDTTVGNGRASRRFQQVQTATANGSEQIKIDGRSFIARKVILHFESQSWENGVLTADGYEYFMDQWYVPELGVMVRGEIDVNLNPGTYHYSYQLIDIED